MISENLSLCLRFYICTLPTISQESIVCRNRPALMELTESRASVLKGSKSKETEDKQLLALMELTKSRTSVLKGNTLDLKNEKKDITCNGRLCAIMDQFQRFTNEELSDIIDNGKLDECVNPTSKRKITIRSTIIDCLYCTLRILIKADLSENYIISFAKASFKDKDLPYREKRLEKIFTDDDDKEKYINKQAELLSVKFELGEHLVIDDIQMVPFLRYGTLKREGSYGVIYKVREVNTENFYARKVINSLTHGQNVAARERRILSCIPKHLHLLELRASYECSGESVFILNPWVDLNMREFMNSMDSYKFWKKRNKSEKPFLIINWIVCLSSALCSLHQSGIKHRDIKPDNILLKEEQSTVRPIICDYGLSKKFYLESKSSSINNSIYYQAPEERNEGKSGRAADVFSLGAVFIELSYILMGIKQQTRSKILGKDGYANNTDNTKKVINKLVGGNDENIWIKIRDLLTKMTHQNPDERLRCSEVLSNTKDIAKNAKVELRCKCSNISYNINFQSYSQGENDEMDLDIDIQDHIYSPLV